MYDYSYPRFRSQKIKIKKETRVQFLIHVSRVIKTRRNAHTIACTCVSGVVAGPKGCRWLAVGCWWLEKRVGGSKHVLLARYGVLEGRDAWWWIDMGCGRLKTHEGGLKWGVSGSRRMWVAPDACWWVETIKKRGRNITKNSPNKGLSDARRVIWALAGVPTWCRVSWLGFAVRG